MMGRTNTKDRRQQIDIWAKALFYLNIAAWVLLLFLFLIFHRAQPEFETLFDRFYQLKLRTEWDMEYIYYLIYCIALSIFICLSGLLLSIFRGRRQTDHKKALIITGTVSLLMLLVSLKLL